MSGLSVSWRFALVSLRFSLAYEARRSPQWKIRDFPLGATALDGPPVEGGPLGFLFRSGAPDQAGFFTREASGGPLRVMAAIAAMGHPLRDLSVRR